MIETISARGILGAPRNLIAPERNIFMVYVPRNLLWVWFNRCILKKKCMRFRVRTFEHEVFDGDHPGLQYVPRNWQVQPHWLAIHTQENSVSCSTVLPCVAQGLREGTRHRHRFDHRQPGTGLPRGERVLDAEFQAEAPPAEGEVSSCVDTRLRIKLN